MNGLNDGLSMRLGRSAWRIAIWLPMLLATSGCIANLPQSAPTPIILSQPVPLQRPAPHARHVARAAHLALPTEALPTESVLSEEQTAEKERLFRSFIDWQGAQDNAP